MGNIHANADDAMEELGLIFCVDQIGSLQFNGIDDGRQGNAGGLAGREPIVADTQLSQETGQFLHVMTDTRSNISRY
eukprot:CAMPEP_0201890012 /NCGR_PEP_ID=MMETSP0902-20130614/31376_1 /ASSEMBLY_ACC=CAM_ASM_000551 /TAXON_ID=420261 /ORGANISM="Thalassiosira antarctica, Strain CCMP982" /LENGTH=76 /DNA_ID=CAMNT_0048420759 /DNA_START=92 /DNA_END=322 /DNA_ORIENTATION=+